LVPWSISESSLGKYRQQIYVLGFGVPVLRLNCCSAVQYHAFEFFTCLQAT
jgi:hypothetical protein